MKIILLFLAFALIIGAGLLYNIDHHELKAYRGYFWIPIAVSFLLFSFVFLQKDSGENVK